MKLIRGKYYTVQILNSYACSYKNITSVSPPPILMSSMPCKKKKSKTGYCRFVFHILSRYCECYINIFHASVWCELLNHHDFIVSGKEHSLQWCHLLLLYLFSLFLLCLSLLQKQLSCQSQAFVFRITFTTIIFHHKEYGYIHTGSFIFLPAVGSRS